jgi:hypothetical protein
VRRLGDEQLSHARLGWVVTIVRRPLASRKGGDKASSRRIRIPQFGRSGLFLTILAASLMRSMQSMHATDGGRRAKSKVR